MRKLGISIGLRPTLIFTRGLSSLVDLTLNGVTALAENEGVIQVTLDGIADDQDTVYYVAVPTGNTAPTTAEVEAGTASGGGTATFSGSFTWISEGNVDITLTDGLGPVTVDLYVLIYRNESTKSTVESATGILVDTTAATLSVTQLDNSTVFVNNGSPVVLDSSGYTVGETILFLGGSTGNNTGGDVTAVTFESGEAHETALTLHNVVAFGGATAIFATGTVSTGGDIASSEYLVTAAAGRWNGAIFRVPEGFTVDSVTETTGANPSASVNVPEGGVVLACLVCMNDTSTSFTAGVTSTGVGNGVLATRNVRWGKSPDGLSADASYSVTTSAGNTETVLLTVVLNPS